MWERAESLHRLTLSLSRAHDPILAAGRPRFRFHLRYYPGAWGGLAVFGIGAQRVRTVYQRHEILITKLCGVMFIGFAINALAHALQGLFGSKPA